MVNEVEFGFYIKYIGLTLWCRNNGFLDITEQEFYIILVFHLLGQILANR
jgi:hypothetical protein